MLFNSYSFLFVFLPLSFLGYVLASYLRSIFSVSWLLFCSLVFYGVWNPALVLLLIGSIVFNFVAGRYIGRLAGAPKQAVFVLAVAANLLVLIVCKYLVPMLDFASQYGLLHDKVTLEIILPLGISFFTFTQIGFLVDRRDGLGGDLDPVRYSLFVTFFPHLIAGPILHVREIGRQLLDPETFKPRIDRLPPGITLFVLGLAKKVLIADPLAATVAMGYDHPTLLTFTTGWATALAYSMELYFDFSGYSDMAIGIADIFGFRFPMNFNSPYKSRGVIEYWQRWHMTLSRYLALLIFNPIAMSISRRRVSKGLKVSSRALKEDPTAFMSLLALPTFVTMGLAGVWHGAGLQFIVFGLLHAAYLVINHAARVFGSGPKAKHERLSSVQIIWRVGLTYIAVLVASIFFRADSCGSAVELLYAMIGGHGIGLPVQLSALAAHLPGPMARMFQAAVAIDSLNIIRVDFIIRLVVCLAMVWLAPNTHQILGAASSTLEHITPAKFSLFRWTPTPVWSVGVALLFLGVIMNLNRSTTFLYFQF